MNQYEELEALVSENEPEPAPSDMAMNVTGWAYHGAVILIDGGTAFMIGALTIWFYGVIWFLANAIVFFVHHSNWERPENNDKQTKLSMVGMIVSVVTMFIAAAGVGTMYLLGTAAGWFQVAVEIFAVVVFFYHSISFAIYRFVDDQWQIERQIAKAKANARKKIAITKAAGSVVAANKQVLNERKSQYSQHGRQVVESALAKVEGRPFNPRPVPMASEMRDETENPTQGGE